MKKTIIITLCMLCAFGALLYMGSTVVSDRWQQHQQDDVSLSVVSPVERVNKEVKEYSFDRFENFAHQPPYDDWYRQWNQLKTDHKEGMLTYAEAAAQGGTLAEELCTDLDLKDKTVALELISVPDKSGANVFCGYYYNEEETVYTIAYFIDAFTGKLVYLYYNAPHQRVPYTTDFEYSDEEWNYDLIRKENLNIIEILGYSSREFEMNTIKRAYENTGNILESKIKTADGTVFRILHCADEENNYPVTQITNCTVLFGETEIKP